MAERWQMKSMWLVKSRVETCRKLSKSVGGPGPIKNWSRPRQRFRKAIAHFQARSCKNSTPTASLYFQSSKNKILIFLIVRSRGLKCAFRRCSQVRGCRVASRGSSFEVVVGGGKAPTSIHAMNSYAVFRPLGCHFY